MYWGRRWCCRACQEKQDRQIPILHVLMPRRKSNRKRVAINYADIEGEDEEEEREEAKEEASEY